MLKMLTLMWINKNSLATLRRRHVPRQQLTASRLLVAALMAANKLHF